MLAGGHFLRVDCGRSDVPDDVKLQRTAMRAAQHRGWDTQAAGYRQLPALTQARYLTLQQDNQLLTDKCTTLSRSTCALSRRRRPIRKTTWSSVTVCLSGTRRGHKNSLRDNDLSLII